MGQCSLCLKFFPPGVTCPEHPNANVVLPSAALAVPNPALRIAEPLAAIAPAPASAVVEGVVTNSKTAVVGKLRKFADLNHDGKLDLADLKISARFAWKVILFLSRFLPDHTVVGKSADRLVGAVDSSGLRGELEQ